MKTRFLLPLLLILFLSVDLSLAQTRINGVMNAVFSAVTVTTLDTGQGANELYDMNQNTTTTTAVAFDSVTIGPTDGVFIQDDGDGALVLAGVGTGQDENLVINFDDTANVVDFSTSTGVVLASFSGMAVSAPLFIDGFQQLTIDGATTGAATAGFINLSCTGAETLTTLTGGSLGVHLYMINADTDCTLDDTEAATATTFSLTGANADNVGSATEFYHFIYNGTQWQQVSASDNN